MNSDIHSLEITSGVIPTDQQTILLKACLLEGDTAMAAYAEWISKIGIIALPGDAPPDLGLPRVYDRIDPGSQRLLSLLYKNLSNQGDLPPSVQKLRGYYKYVWLRNNIIKHKLQKLVQQFQKINVQPMLLKGIAQIEVYYKDYGTRPTLDIDIAVRAGDLEDTVALLLSAGWQSRFGDPHRIKQSQIHAHTFFADGVELDLHTHFSAYHLKPSTEELFWNSATNTAEGYCLMRPAYELYCTLLHGYQWNEIPPIRWVSDAVMLIRSFDENEWAAFAELMNNEPYDFPVSMLQFIQSNNLAAIPEDVFAAHRTGKQDDNIKSQIAYALTPHSSDDFTGIRRLILKIHQKYKSNPAKTLQAIIAHYLYVWNKKNIFDLAPAIVSKIAEKMKLGIGYKV